MSETDAIIQIEDLCRKYTRGGKDFFALQDVSLSLKTGEALVITGRSGSGKTTLLNIIGGLEQPSSGSVRVCGHDLPGMDESKLADFRRDRVGFVFQAFHLIEEKSALANVMLPLSFTGASSGRSKERALHHLQRVGLEEIVHEPVRTFSAGQKQRVALARSFVNGPEVILADEPTGNLDRENAQSVFKILSAYAAQEGKTVCIATHDVDVLPEEAGAFRRISIENGRLTGDPQTD